MWHARQDQPELPKLISSQHMIQESLGMILTGFSIKFVSIILTSPYFNIDIHSVRRGFTHDVQ